MLLGSLLLTVATPQVAQAQDSWQYHMAQANSFYRNKLLPKALAQLKEVVNDPEGAKQLKAWTLIQQIAVKLKNLEDLVWALERGRELAKGPEAAQMQAQLYRLKRAYGRVVYEATGGSGKLSTRGVKLKALGDIDDPEQKSYFEKARLTMGQVGISEGIYWLPVGEYEIDGEVHKIVGGKDTKIEVAPTTFATLGLEVDFGGGARAGATVNGRAAGLGMLHVGVGPHIQFASGNSLLISVGPLLQVGAQATPDRQQDVFTSDSRARLNAGGLLLVGFEFSVGKIDLSPRIGFHLSYENAYYFEGRVVAPSVGEGDERLPATVLEGSFLVPALSFGPRVGLNAIVSPAIVKGKRRPRLFVGVTGGPSFAQPLWGSLDEGEINTNLTEREPDSANPWSYTNYKFVSTENEARDSIRVYVDIQAVLGIQLRL
ncbi:MAG: hypothetical protein KDA24_02720 [Deltaproteobacteria bacterium]|nr:hypothetical protein [Deltaproteobacteria bacterium]